MLGKYFDSDEDMARAQDEEFESKFKQFRSDIHNYWVDKDQLS
jgi:hypothetical protein